MRLALLPVVMLLPAACGIVEWGDSGRFTEEFRQTCKFEPGGRLVVEGFIGGVEIRRWDRPNLEAGCVKYAAREEDLGRIRLDVAVTSGLATVRALRSEDLLRPGSVGVDYRIMAPARAVLDRVVTTNGPVELRIEGKLTGDVDVRTSNGPITVRLAEGSGFRLRARTTNGRVTSDFAVEPGTRERRTRMEGTVSAGGPVVELSTSNGAVGVIRH
jgi:hypothetical protein